MLGSVWSLVTGLDGARLWSVLGGDAVTGGRELGAVVVVDVDVDVCEDDDDGGRRIGVLVRVVAEDLVREWPAEADLAVAPLGTPPEVLGRAMATPLLCDSGGPAAARRVTGPASLIGFEVAPPRAVVVVGSALAAFCWAVVERVVLEVSLPRKPVLGLAVAVAVASAEVAAWAAEAALVVTVEAGGFTGRRLGETLRRASTGRACLDASASLGRLAAGAGFRKERVLRTAAEDDDMTGG